VKLGRWRILDRFEIPHMDRPEVNYLDRWRILETPWGSIFLHRIGTPDSRPTLHDHPWSFVSIVLAGGYLERRLNLHTRQVEARRVRRVNVMRRDDSHAITALEGGRPCWTLLLVGARRRKWGYLRPVSSLWAEIAGHQPEDAWTWVAFDVDEHAHEFDAALAARARQKETHR
jgi:hypothetical protein